MYKSMQRLRLSKSDRILVLNAPKSFGEFEQYFTSDIDREIRGRAYRCVFLFCETRQQAEENLTEVLKATAYDALFWFCFPKARTQENEEGLDRAVVTELFAPRDMEPVTQRTINENWTALRIRPKELVRHRRK